MQDKKRHKEIVNSSYIISESSYLYDFFIIRSSYLYVFFIFKLEFNLNVTPMINYKFLLRASFTYLLTLISVMAFTQDRWQEGYIHTTEGNSLYSEIDVAMLEDAPEECIYRIPGSREQLLLRANKIRSVSLLSGRAFETKTFKLEDDHVTAIVEYLVDGVADVFVYRRKGEDIFLLESESKPLTVARFTTKKAESPDPSVKDIEVRSYRHIGLLKAFMSDAPSLHERINTMQMNQKNLVDLAEMYHDLTCTTEKSCITYKKEGIFTMSMFAPAITAAVYSIHMTEQETGNVIDFAQAYGGGIGGVFSFPVYRKGIRLDLEVEASFTKSSHSASFSETDGRSENIHHLAFDYSALRLNPGIRISVRPNKLTYTAFVGPSVALTLSEYMESNEDIYRDGSLQMNYEYNDLAYSSGLIGLRGYIGMMIKVTDFNMLHMMLGFDTLTGTKPMSNLYTTAARDYKINEQSLNLKTVLYF